MFPTVLEAVQCLRCYQLPLSIADATCYLRGLRIKVQLFGLYQHFFPEEFATTNAYTTPASSEIYSERELEFLDFVNSRLFPLYLYEDTAYEDGERYFDSIPLYPPTEDWYEYFYEWNLGWQLLLILEGTVFEYSGPEEIASRSEVLEWAIARIEMGNSISLDQLEKVCAGVSEPLCYLSDAIAEITRVTGNIWLDYVAEWGHTIEDIEWTIENVQALADLWLEAERIRANGKALADWIEADPKQHFQQVIKLWNSCRVS